MGSAGGIGVLELASRWSSCDPQVADRDVGPVKVTKEASSLAEAGWSVYLVLAKTARGWRLLESGNVYP